MSKDILLTPRQRESMQRRLAAIHKRIDPTRETKVLERLGGPIGNRIAALPTDSPHDTHHEEVERLEGLYERAGEFRTRKLRARRVTLQERLAQDARLQEIYKLIRSIRKDAKDFPELADALLPQAEEEFKALVAQEKPYIKPDVFATDPPSIRPLPIRQVWELSPDKEDQVLFVVPSKNGKSPTEKKNDPTRLVKNPALNRAFAQDSKGRFIGSTLVRVAFGQGEVHQISGPQNARIFEILIQYCGENGMFYDEIADRMPRTISPSAVRSIVQDIIRTGKTPDGFQLLTYTPSENNPNRKTKVNLVRVEKERKMVS